MRDLALVLAIVAGAFLVARAPERYGGISLLVCVIAAGLLAERDRAEMQPPEPDLSTPATRSTIGSRT